MKKLHFVYETRLRFDQAVSGHRFRLHCIPSSDAVQHIYGLNCRVAPAAVLRYNTDCFGNDTCVGSVEAFHTEFAFRTEGMAFVDHTSGERTGYHPIYRYASALTGADDGIKDFYETAPLRGEAGLDWVLSCMDRLYGVFQYEAGSTNVNTGAAEAFRQRKGVCQDYSHIMLAVLRLARIPARYAAGLLAGEGETHAWTEVYLDGQWIGLDPTHNRLTDDSYIKLSHGRDYRDCMPNRGIFTGRVSQSVQIYAKVEEGKIIY